MGYRSLTGASMRRARLIDVVLWGALLTGCPVHVVPNVPDTLNEGPGAGVAKRRRRLAHLVGG
jgi:hypothetical protein